jgi:DNA repair photolyase
MKILNGKAIYSPKGAAGEYAAYGCNLYVGCSCGCAYCYNKTKRFKATLGGDTPTLKKCFKSEEHALEIFEKELKASLPELQKHGLFFSFTTDPMLPETMNLTLRAMQLCCMASVPVKILTKRTDFACCSGAINGKKVSFAQLFVLFKSTIAIGFTLTGHDEIEPNASPNAERIAAMRKLHEAGFKTWASIEPIIGIYDSANMISKTIEFCDLYKVGIMSGKEYSDVALRWLIHNCGKTKAKFYFKDSLLKAAGMTREMLPASCVGGDYSIFT